MSNMFGFERYCYVNFYYATDVEWLDVDGCPTLNEFMHKHVNELWDRDNSEESKDPDELEVFFDRNKISYLKENLPVQAIDELYKIDLSQYDDGSFDVNDVFIWFEDESSSYFQIADYDYHTEVFDKYDC